MVLKSRILFLTLFFLVILGSVSGVLNTLSEPELLYQDSISQPDNNAQEVTTPKDFSISKTTLDDFEKIKQQVPLDAPLPDNVKTTVEYDIRSGNYVMRTRVGDMEIATPFTLTEKEYVDFSAKNELKD